MLYQASRDGFGASVFHAKCDGVIGTLTIVRTMISYIIGGYTSADWSGYYSFKYDPSAFLFSLTNPFNIPFRSNVTQPSNAILAYPYMGPNFGHDLTINDQANMSSSNFFNFQPFYYSQNQFINNYSNSSNNSASSPYTYGYYNFQALEIEVYSLDRKF